MKKENRFDEEEYPQKKQKRKKHHDNMKPYKREKYKYKEIENVV